MAKTKKKKGKEGDENLFGGGALKTRFKLLIGL
jgi:hypothetical protein